MMTLKFYRRDITYMLLADLLTQPQGLKSRATGLEYPLRTYVGLTGYIRTRVSRLQPISATKPFVKAHYGEKKVAEAKESTICVKNGLHYSMVDSTSSRLAKDLLGPFNVAPLCDFQLPSGQYKMLQYVVSNSTQTSNVVLAKQSDSPNTMNLHEFYEFAMLRSGHRLQWRNIANGLITRVLNFTRNETYLLMAQAVWQAGPPAETPIFRESHIDLQEYEFGADLLSALEDALVSVKGSWQNSAAVRTFVIIASRLLSLSPYSQLHQDCYDFLERAREVARDWTRDIVSILHRETDTRVLADMNLQALEVALTCYGTFDVDENHIQKLLCSCAAVSTLIECSITIHDICPAQTDHLPQWLKLLIWRSKRLSHLLMPFVQTSILQNQVCIDNTMNIVWEGYRSGGDWVALETPSERWIKTQTSSKDGFVSKTVHYNIMSGSLLVNRKPLTRLPKSYETHNTFRRLFGDVRILSSHFITN
jgi:hypothetical protein